MKRSLVFLSCLIILCHVTTAQRGPVMTPETEDIDFGERYTEKDDYRQKYVVTNTGDAPLIITNAVSSCGCLVIEWPKEPIMPGEKGIFTAKYDISRIGPINKTITITTNEIKEVDCQGLTIYKQYSIKVKGIIKRMPGPLADLDGNINFGIVYTDEDSGIRYEKLMNKGTEDLHILSVESPDHIQVSVPEIIKPGETVYIKIRYDTSRQGMMSETVYLLTNQVKSLRGETPEMFRAGILIKGEIIIKK